MREARRLDLRASLQPWHSFLNRFAEVASKSWVSRPSPGRYPAQRSNLALLSVLSITWRSARISRSVAPGATACQLNPWPGAIAPED